MKNETFCSEKEYRNKSNKTNQLTFDFTLSKNPYIHADTKFIQPKMFRDETKNYNFVSIAN